MLHRGMEGKILDTGGESVLLTFSTSDTVGTQDEGVDDGIIAKTATGTYTITLKKVPGRTPTAVVQCLTAGKSATYTVSGSVITILTTTSSSGSAADASFVCWVKGHNAVNKF